MSNKSKATDNKTMAVDVLAVLRQIADGEGDAQVLAMRVHAATAELIKAVDKLFGADMEHCMEMDGKEDQLEAVQFAKSALARQPVGEPVDDDWHLRGYAYASKQATNCAGCGKHKHTPLRIDAMGGHVCLTCIDHKLGALLGEFGYPTAQAVDLGQFRRPIVEWRSDMEKWVREHGDPRGAFGPDLAEADRLLNLIDSRAVGDPVLTWSVLQIGNEGSFYDPNGTRRAFTYEKQPGNDLAAKLGYATNEAYRASAGDSIDRGLSLLKSLQDHGFGVFQTGEKVGQ